MDYVKPPDVLKAMLDAGTAKAGLPTRDLILRAAMSGGILACATSFAMTAAQQTNAPILGAVLFPAGFVMIIVLGLELVTGSFALVPLAGVAKRTSWAVVARSLGWAFLGNLLGSVLYGALLALALTYCGSEPASGIGPKLVALSETKTLAYAAHGFAGMGAAFVKGMLCNWMVCLGAVMGLTSTSTLGKIVGAWLPISVFFAQGFEHAVVNLFVIPTGMLLGAKVSMADWWLWNQIPVTLGNLAGGLLFTGLALYWTYAPARAPKLEASVAAAIALEPSADAAE